MEDRLFCFSISTTNLAEMASALDANGKDFIEARNPDSLKVVTAYVGLSLAAAKPDQKFQFERFGYFVADRLDHVVGVKPVFNRVTGLKDSWGK